MTRSRSFQVYFKNCHNWFCYVIIHYLLRTCCNLKLDFWKYNSGIPFSNLKFPSFGYINQFFLEVLRVNLHFSVSISYLYVIHAFPHARFPESLTTSLLNIYQTPLPHLLCPIYRIINYLFYFQIQWTFFSSYFALRFPIWYYSWNTVSSFLLSLLTAQCSLRFFFLYSILEC